MTVLGLSLKQAPEKLPRRRFLILQLTLGSSVQIMAGGNLRHQKAVSLVGRIQISIYSLAMVPRWAGRWELLT